MSKPTVHAIGDSVMQGAGPTLYNTLPTTIPGITIDAAPNRQFRHATKIARQRTLKPPCPQILIVHLGTNGLFTANTFDQLIETATSIGVKRLLFINVCAPREWVPNVNSQLAASVNRHQHTTSLIDWNELTQTRPELLHHDGFHMNQQGATAYAQMIAAAVGLGFGEQWNMISR